MGNMSYCRFRNTLLDLRDCYDALTSGGRHMKDDMDDEEAQARVQLIRLCKEIGDRFDEEE